MANATSVERQILEASGCPVRAMLDHILDVFKRADLNDFILESYSSDDDAASVKSASCNERCLTGSGARRPPPVHKSYNGRM